MKTKEVSYEINGSKKNVSLRELAYMELFEIDGTLSAKEKITKLWILSGFPQEDLMNVSKEDGFKITEAVNELNGWGNFQNPSQ